jgi:molecular chaperone DnaJ
VIPISKKLSIKIPAGVDNGIQMNLRGEGEGGSKGGSNGNLYVVLEVEDHPVFKRHGNDILLEKKISMVTATLGEELEVETPAGLEKLKIPKGAQTGEVLKLKGKGMPHLQEKKHGELLVHLFVQTPKDLTDRQEELLKAFAAETSKSSSKKTSESSFTKSGKHSKKSKSSWF